MKPRRTAAPRLAPPLLMACLLVSAARGQEPSTGTEAGASSTPTKTQKVADLTARYRLTEHYTTQESQAGPGLLGPYRVAIIEDFKDSVDSPQGAPKRTEMRRHSVFTERPTELGTLGNVVAVARTYERFRDKPEDLTRMMGGRPLDHASVLIRPRFGELPQAASLVEGRLLTEHEYDVLGRQIIVAQLSAVLPAQVVRIGDSWRLSRKATQALLGDPLIQGDSLSGKLDEIRKEVDGPRMVASIKVGGKVGGFGGETTTVNAELLFTFLPEAAPKATPERPTPPARGSSDVIEAKGAITEVRLARVTAGPLPGKERLRYRSNREVTLHRQLGLVEGAPAPPKVDKGVEPTGPNSGLVHVDPAGRYAFQHSQDLLPPDRSQPTAKVDTSLLMRNTRAGRDLLQVEFSPKILKPEDLKKELADKYGMLKKEVIKGDESWLPEAEWPNVKVYRIDAEVKIADPKAASTVGSTRIHFEGYLILFSQSSSLIAIATTSRDSVGPYRQEVETILKSIKLDPPRPALD